MDNLIDKWNDKLNNWPLITIGIPTYNRPKGLKRTLTRIINQTYPNLDIVVSDNCSTTPETEKIVNSFVQKDRRIRFFQQKTNKGPVYNFLFLVKQAKGDYFMWAADDDYFANNDLVEKLMIKMMESKNYLLIFPDFNLINKKRNQIKRHIASKYFENCKNDVDYFLSSSIFSTNQIYGLFNLLKLRECEIPLRVDPNYYENLCLAEVFSHGGIRFVKNVCINVTDDENTLSSKSRPFPLLFINIKLWFIIVYIYLNSNFSFDKRLQAVAQFSLKQVKYILMLALSCMRLRNLKNILK